VKIFVDTANFDDIRTANDWGIVDGVTTNPSLAGREGRPFREIVEEICEIMGERPVSAEVVATDTEDMLKEAREVASWASNVVVKIPLIPDGIKAITILYQEGIKVNCTLCFSRPCLPPRLVLPMFRPLLDDWMISATMGWRW